MNSIKALPILILFLASLFACEKEVINVDTPVVQPQLVVNSFLNPDADSTLLFLSWSVPIFHNSDMNISYEDKAKVYIIENGKEHQLSYSHHDNYYFIPKSSMRVKEGENYKLKILCDQSKDLTAETIIPPKPVFELSYLGMDSLPIEKSADSYKYIYSVKIKIHNPDNKGYYRILAKGLLKDESHPDELYEINLNLIGKSNRFFYGDYEGVLEIKDESYYMNPQSMFLKKIIISVDKVDETFYLYNHALENYSDIDVFTEPTQVYSNIEDAFGVFCSYNTKSDTLDVK